jgi:hypothetical protein
MFVGPWLQAATGLVLPPQSTRCLEQLVSAQGCNRRICVGLESLSLAQLQHMQMLRCGASQFGNILSFSGRFQGARLQPADMCGPWKAFIGAATAYADATMRRLAVWEQSVLFGTLQVAMATITPQKSRELLQVKPQASSDKAVVLPRLIWLIPTLSSSITKRNPVRCDKYPLNRKHRALTPYSLYRY